MPVVEVETLDDIDLAGAWARAVTVGDAPLVAALEAEAFERGTDPQRALVAARREGNRFDAVAQQTKKNIAEGKTWDTGQRTLKVKPGEKGKKAGQKSYGKDSDSSPGGSKGSTYVPARKKAGKDGGGRFTTPDDPDGTGGKGGGGGGGGSSKADKDAEKVAAQQERDAKTLFRIGQERQEAEAAAKRGEGYSKLITHMSKIRKAREEQLAFAKDEDKPEAQRVLDLARKDEQDARDADAKFKADKVTAKEAESAQRTADREAETTAKATTRKAERDAATKTREDTDAANEAQSVAEYAKTVQGYYDKWETDLRDRYKNEPSVSEAELQDLVLQDRARRAKSLPARVKPPKTKAT